MRIWISIVAAVLLSGAAQAENIKVIKISSVTELAAFYDSLGYKPAANPEILQAIPRTRFTGVPKNWNWNESGVPLKKSAFFRAAASGVLQANELILADRAKLEGLDPSALSDEDRAWLATLAGDYGVDAEDPLAMKNQLMLRVDAIPASLALAQGAVESGWGTSRFARQGNAMFGQWTQSGGIKAEGSSARLAAFDTPFDAVIGYMKNLNTHRAYEGLRKSRAEMRANGKVPDGYGLATHLSSYAETGQEYVDLLRNMIKGNNLSIADDARLSDQPLIMIDPQ